MSGDTPHNPLSPDTRLLHTRREAASEVRTVGPPIQKGSTVLLPNAAALYDDSGVITYGRSGLGAHEALESALCELEGATGVTFFPSGLAAVTAAMMAVLRAGDEVLVSDAIYKPTRRSATVSWRVTACGRPTIPLAPPPRASWRSPARGRA